MAVNKTKIKKRTSKKTTVNTLLSKLSGSRLRVVLFVILFALLGSVYIFKTQARVPDGDVGSNLSVSRSKIIYIANGQIGQKEYSPSVLKYTDGNREPWCADFVSWVYRTAGYPFKGGLSGGWRYSVGSYSHRYSLKNYTQSIGRYKVAGSYVPLPGDIIMFNPITFGYSHAGIVTKVQNTPYGKIVSTTEGNRSGQVQQHSYWINDSRILGYGDMF